MIFTVNIHFDKSTHCSLMLKSRVNAVHQGPRNMLLMLLSVQRTFRYFFKLVWGYVGSWHTWKIERMCVLLCVCE